MKITRENYPLFFLDYFEARLSEGCKEELMLFLEEHPDLKEEFLAFEPVHLEKDTGLEYPDKENLKKHAPASAPGPHAAPIQAEDLDRMFVFDESEKPFVSPDFYELALAAYVEGDLNDQERLAVEEYVKGDPVRERELRLMMATRADASDDPVHYPGKKALKRYFLGVSLPGMRSVAAAAAVVLVAFVSWQMFWGIQDGAFQDMLVDGNGDVPEAVAEAPSLQQAVDGSERPELLDPYHVISLPESMPATPQPDLLARVEPDVPVAENFREIKTERLEEHVYFSSLQVASMALIRPVALSTEVRAERTQPQLRQEYYWLAFRDRRDLFVEEADDAGALPAGEPSPADQLARREQPGGLRSQVALLEEAANTDVSTVGTYARRGLASINNLLGKPVVVDGETTPEGRRVELAIGSFFEVSRSTE